jgi:catechol 2,3-dioxygenase-like lactoylglutathione lyase family enzyme
MEYVSTFSSFSVDDIEAAKRFYSEVLGLETSDEMMGLRLTLHDDGRVHVYLKDDHQPAVFTVLNFVVGDIDAAIDSLTAKGIVMERYDSLPAEQDEKGVLRGLGANMGPDIAWFKDPAGNILSVLQEV